MVNRKPSPKKERKRYTFQFSFSSLFVLSISLFFILGWVFFLGIMVGRGFLPNTIETFSLIKKKIVKDEEKKKNDHVKPIKEDELSFYNQLVDKKDRTKKKVTSSPLLKDKDRAIEKKKVVQLKEDIHNYSVQIAALKDKVKTEKMVERLTRLGYQAYYYKILINGEMFYRIRCGPFPNIEEAKNYAKRLADKEGFKPFIIYPSNK